MSGESPSILDLLTREGVLIGLRIRFWRAAKKLRAHELGLDEANVSKKLISLGHKRLLPRDALADFALIESRAHALVADNTFPFMGGIGRFLPNTKLEQVRSGLNKLKGEFNSRLERFYEEYDMLRHNSLQEWRAEAPNLCPDDPQRVVDSVITAFPDAGRLERYFGFSFNLFQMQAPETLDSRLVSFGDQQAIAEAREEATRVAKVQIDAGVEEFVGECVTALREQTATLCDEMLESFKGGKSGVHQRTLNRLVDFIGHFRELNFVGDKELEAHLNDVRQRFLNTTAESYRQDPEARMRMLSGIRNLGNAARELAQQDAQELVANFGKLGVGRKFTMAA